MISKRNNELCAARWYLELIKKSGTWDLEILEEHEIKDLIENYNFILDQPGTIVLCEDIDALRGDGAKDMAVDQAAKIDESKAHLSLVFHRFIEDKLITIEFNNDLLKPLNPFLAGKSKSHQTPTQQFPIRPSSNSRSGVPNEIIEFTGYTLPPLSSIKSSDKEVAELGDGL